jgi:hypothetical protein
MSADADRGEFQGRDSRIGVLKSSSLLTCNTSQISPSSIAGVI